MKKGVGIFFIVYFSILISLISVSAWELSGFAYDTNGNLLYNATINVTVRNSAFSVVGYNFTNSNVSGWFNLSVANDNSWMYQPVLKHFIDNSTTGTGIIDFVGQSLPAFPYSELSSGIVSAKFYLKPAGTLNITAINRTAGRTTFQYIVKDTTLGYPIAEGWSAVSEVNIQVPSNRNYSISVYPQQALPVSFNWNNFSSTTDYSAGSLMSYNSTTKVMKKTFNLTETLVVYSGQVFNTSGGVSDWNQLYILPFIIEPGGMVYLGSNAMMPYNMSAWNATAYSDLYYLANGTYSITLPGPAEGIDYLLFVTARNATNYYGSYKNISLSWGSSHNTGFNFTTYSLMDTNWASSTSNFTMGGPTGGAQLNISSARYGLRLVNSTNSSLSGIFAHVEVTVDYLSYGAREFTFMTDVAQGSSTIVYLPLINSTGIKEANVYTMNYAPKRVGVKSVSQLIANPNISLSVFNPQALDATLSSSSIIMELRISNSTCDVPNPVGACNLGSSSSMSNFNPLSSIIGGGKLSFRMGYGNILIHYVNVDMLASGPPDVNFDSSASESTSGSFSSIMRFGSQGPRIYDYVLISMPYTEGSTSTTGLNEGSDLNVSIPYLYDEDWNLIWNSSSNGSAAASLGGNWSHYSTYQNDWAILMGNNNCTRNSSLLNASMPCYLDTSNNRIWIRLPHFSGTRPNVVGTVVSATASSLSSGGSGSSYADWTFSYSANDKELSEKGSITYELGVKTRVKLNISNEEHYVGVTNVTATTADIEVASTPQKVTMSIGETKKFDVNNDKFYDLSVTLDSITNLKAKVIITSLHEAIPDTSAGTGEQPGIGGSEQGGGIVSKLANVSIVWKVILAIIVILIIAVIIIVYLRRSKKRPPKWK